MEEIQNIEFEDWYGGIRNGHVYLAHKNDELGIIRISFETSHSNLDEIKKEIQIKINEFDDKYKYLNKEIQNTLDKAFKLIGYKT